MDVAHAADEYLLAFGILFHLAGRIFFTDFRQRRHQFFFVAFLFRNHGNCMERIGEADRIVFYREFCRSKGITCTSMGQFRNDDDITGNSFFDWYLFFADEGKHLAQFFFRILGHIIQLIPFFEFTGENADVTQFSCKGIDECLKYKSRERLVGIYHDRFARLFIRSHHDFLGCVRHITDEPAQKFCRSDMMDGTAAHDRAYPAGQHTLAQTLAQFVDSQFFPFQIFFQQFVIAFSGGFHAHFTDFTGFGHIFCRYFDFFSFAIFPFPGNHLMPRKSLPSPIGI